MTQAGRRPCSPQIRDEILFAACDLGGVRARRRCHELEWCSGGTPSQSVNQMDNCAIRVHGLRIRRGSREVLHGLGFALHRGSVTGLLGPSGCGKTTLLRAIVGVQIVTAGVIEVLGYPAGSPALRGMLGYSTQSPAVYGDLTVRENLRYFAAVLRTAESEVDRVIAETELGPHAGHIVEHLSGGERSRANLAAALLGSPDLLVLDEPTVGLDPVLRNDLWALFHRLAVFVGGCTLVAAERVCAAADDDAVDVLDGLASLVEQSLDTRSRHVRVWAELQAPEWLLPWTDELGGGTRLAVLTVREGGDLVALCA